MNGTSLDLTKLLQTKINQMKIEQNYILSKQYSDISSILKYYFLKPILILLGILISMFTYNIFILIPRALVEKQCRTQMAEVNKGG